ncbi:hypothetical protein MSI_04680 [Treponema sp. JC4]|uniref:hypothetical protein n=1 Tax=Treponema sp. JC4 TaxID=1124982 RepID=UPI00025B0269|nr:hypothetical protein [Treponema sp. JC4]EID86036.1 hypothetical protein MSI_04680 [Treponema sp. JC4]
MKNITEALSNFSKKLSRFEEAQDKEFVKPQSKDAALQKKINLTEEEKIEKIKAQYGKYLNPVSREIEEDEEAVLSALRIFKAAKNAEQTEVSQKKEKQTSIHQLDFKSPLCQKQEYLYGKNLLYLTYWLQTVHGEKEWIPSIYKFTSGERFLEFIPAETKHYDYEETSILNILKTLNQTGGKIDEKA